MFKFLFFLSLLFFSLNSFGSSNAPQEFSDGINSYKQKNYKEAQSIFTKIASEHPNNVTNLYNLGLTEAKLGRPGVAAAFWRKVLNLQPHYSLARKSLKSISKKLPRGNSRSNWENFRSHALSYFSINHLLFFFTLFFLGCGATCIKYFSRRHIALKNHFPMPSIPKLSWFFIICFLIVTVLFSAKVYDYSKPRATVIADFAPLFLSPSEEDIKISELNQGTEVIIKKMTDAWARVITASGNEGWVQITEIMQTSGSTPL